MGFWDRGRGPFGSWFPFLGSIGGFLPLGCWGRFFRDGLWLRAFLWQHLGEGVGVCEGVIWLSWVRFVNLEGR